MTERKYDDAPNRQDAPPFAVAAHASGGVRPCPNCGAGNHPDATVCETCGEPLRVRARRVRCRHCGKQAPSNLVLCPSCGRELKAARTRWFTWLAPIVLILLVLAVLSFSMQASPVQVVRALTARGVNAFSGLSVQMDPTNLVEMTPIVDELDVATPPSQAVVSSAAPVEESAAEQATTAALAAPTIAPTATPAPTETTAPTATPEPTATTAAVAAATATTAPSPTSAPTATVTPTATRAQATPRVTTPATADPQATPDDQQVDLSALLPTPTDAPGTAADSAADADATAATTPTVDAAQLALALVPTATSTQAPTATPTPVTYTVQPGDTFLAIAARLGVTVDELRAANQLTPDEARLLRPGQVLVVPADEPAAGAALPTPTAVRPTATPTTQAAPTATPVPAPTAVALRLDAPQLRSPENDATIGCNAANSLTWLGVDFIQPTDEYVMHLGFVSGRDDGGNERITWVLNQPRPSNRTSWEMDNDLCALAPQEFGRQWRWYVEVQDAQGETVSPASETWRFSWN